MSQIFSIQKEDSLMEIIEAVWEKRNIGLVTFEIQVSENDSWEELRETIENIQFDYLVVKIPPSKTDFIFKASDLGLIFVEQVTKAHYSGELPMLDSLQQRIIKSFSCKEITLSNKKILLQEISNGLFKTDRVAIDPFLGLEKSSQRYLGWISDELEAGAVIYEVTKEEDLVGFFLIRQTDPNTSHAILAGLLNKYQKSGLGFVLNFLEIKISKDNGANTVHSVFSSNNRGALAVHMSMGYKVDRQHYIYVKHTSSGML
jgi:hypothetical protein